MRGTNLYSIARSLAHKEGIKIVSKESRNIYGYRVSAGFEGCTVELMLFDDCDLFWTAYDMDSGYTSLRKARESARGQLLLK